MFWEKEDKEAGSEVWTKKDMETYTHILYLSVPAKTVSNRRENDTRRHRPQISPSHLDRWQQAEIIKLRGLCLEHDILFSVVPESPQLLDRVSNLLRDFRIHDDEHNLSLLEIELDETFAKKDRAEIVLVFDADRTMAAEDTGVMFWTKAGIPSTLLKNVFSSMGNSYKAFRQAMLLYEERADDYDRICEEIAEAVAIHPDLVTFLKYLANFDHVRVVVITCGLRLAWKLIVEKESLSNAIKVIGGSRLADNFVVSGKDKRALVERLQNVHGQYVWAFGDSPLDIGMLCQANQAVVVVGDKITRSKSMDTALHDAIRGGLVARQVLLPAHSSPRAGIEMLPIIELTNQSFLNSVTRSRQASKNTSPRMFHATGSKAAELLMTPMRNSSVSGPALREAHRLVGRYLALEFIAGVIGLEKYSMRHVQGHKIDGFRLANENQTIIVALMRGGEPMAQGVNDVFPLAGMAHAKIPEDLNPPLLDGQCTVVLVDSVVNTGRSIVDFVRHIRQQRATTPIIVAAGVVQAQSVAHGELAQILTEDENFSIVTLRLSENKFTGRRTTDTGNRLFNTTHIE